MQKSKSSGTSRKLKTKEIIFDGKIKHPQYEFADIEKESR